MQYVHGKIKKNEEVQNQTSDVSTFVDNSFIIWLHNDTKKLVGYLNNMEKLC